MSTTDQNYTNQPKLDDAVSEIKQHDKLDGWLVEDQDLGNLDIKAVELTRSKFARTSFVGSQFKRPTIVNCRFERCELVAVDWSDGGVRNSQFIHCRVSLDLSASIIRDVQFEDCKIDSLNLRMTEQSEITFKNCLIEDLDIYGASAKNVKLESCTIKKLQLNGAKLNKFDISGSEVETVDGITSAKGLIINEGQLYQLSPLMAADIGITVN